MFTNLKRIIKFGWQDFCRNKGLASQVIFIMTIAVLTLTSLFLFRELSLFLIKEAQKKVDISVYFRRETEESKILEVKEELYSFSDQIESVDYVSKEKVLDAFTQAHRGDPIYLQALQEVGDNPFLASLNIKAKNPTFYANISNFLVEGPFKNVIEKVSYYENEKVINRLFTLSKLIKTVGVFAGLILVVLVILITFNTIKLTISNLKDEICTMKLVGASNWFIRGPFLIQGILYGIFAVIIADVLLFGVLTFLSPKLENWLSDFNLLNYFKENIFFLILIQTGFATILAIFSSCFAVRKYLKV